MADLMLTDIHDDHWGVVHFDGTLWSMLRRKRSMMVKHTSLYSNIIAKKGNSTRYILSAKWRMNSLETGSRPGRRCMDSLARVVE